MVLEALPVVAVADNWTPSGLLETAASLWLPLFSMLLYRFGMSEMGPVWLGRGISVL
jgi:hypothetical protein